MDPDVGGVSLAEAGGIRTLLPVQKEAPDVGKAKDAEKDANADEQEYSTKDELKDEGEFFLKDLARSAVKASSRLGRGVINVFRQHPKVEALEEDVQEHVNELEEAERDEDSS